MSRIAIVVPCFDEANRLDVESFLDWLVQRPDVTLVFVNDGSADDTLRVLRELEARLSERVSILDLAHNVGKAEAVRVGLLHVLGTEAEIVGYLDADLATPLSEMDRLLAVISAAQVQVVMGARVSLLGRHIKRDPKRHYLGRVFASIASLALNLQVYDTQCGAKLFRTFPALHAALDKPFLSRWAFDVELIGRMMNPPNDVAPLRVDQIIEEPLLVWIDRPGSKLSLVHMVNSAVDLARISIAIRRASRR